MIFKRRTIISTRTAAPQRSLTCLTLRHPTISASGGDTSDRTAPQLPLSLPPDSEPELPGAKLEARVLKWSAARIVSSAEPQWHLGGEWGPGPERLSTDRAETAGHQLMAIL